MAESRGLQRQVMVGAGWLGGARLMAQFVQFGAGLVLARLLSPADFGVVASVNVIAGFGVLMFEGGLRAALVHAKAPTKRDYSTVFWLNLVGGFVLAGLLTLAAPLIAGFYRQPILTSITPIVGLTFACSTGVVNAAILQRQLKFRASAALESGGTILGIGLTLVLALIGFGPFSLAIGPVFAQVVVSVGYAILSPWKPDLSISWRSLRNLMRYSLPLVGSNISDYWGRNIDSLLVGRFLGAASLGYYSRAYNLMLLPLTQVTQSVGSAVSPALARMQDEPARAGEAYARSLRLISFLTITFMVGMAATAPALVDVLWGRQWQPSVPLLQVLALAGIPQCIQSTTSWLYQSQGRTSTMLRMTLIFNVYSTVLILLGLQWGAFGVCVAVFLRYWTGLPIELFVATRSVRVNTAALAGDLGRSLAPIGFTGAVVALIPIVLGLDPTSPTTLVEQVVVGIALTAANLAVLQRPLLHELRLFRRPFTT